MPRPEKHTDTSYEPSTRFLTTLTPVDAVKERAELDKFWKSTHVQNPEMSILNWLTPPSTSKFSRVAFAEELYIYKCAMTTSSWRIVPSQPQQRVPL
jgi:hypothetical protein